MQGLCDQFASLLLCQGLLSCNTHHKEVCYLQVRLTSLESNEVLLPVLKYYCSKVCPYHSCIQHCNLRLDRASFDHGLQFSA